MQLSRYLGLSPRWERLSRRFLISLRAFSHLGGFRLAASASGRTFTLSGQLFFLKLSSLELSFLCFLLRGLPFRTFVLPFLPLFRGFLLLNFRSSVFCLRGSSLSGFSSLRVSLLSAFASGSPHSGFRPGGSQWTRTTDLSLIRRVL